MTSFLPSSAQSVDCATGRRCRHSSTGQSHGERRRTMRSAGLWYPPALCFCGRKRGKRLVMVPLPRVRNRHPYIGALQTSVSRKRQFSCIFPAHPRSLASVLIPRPAALGVLLRSQWRTPSASGFPNKNRPRNIRTAAAQSAGEIFLRSLHRKHAFGLGSGAHSRRFAQECPEGNPGKYNQGEKQWHSTKTKSL
jgi:hypothetical protein